MAFACPMFVEFFPDPVLVKDQEGEYVEIRLDDFSSDSLYVQFENKAPLVFAYPKGKRLVLVHDTVQCPSLDGVACELMGTLSLPNSRESAWKLWAGACLDSVNIPAPKAGLAIQRVKDSDEWTLTAGSFGTADPNYEYGIEDCGLSRFEAEFNDNRWFFSGWLTGCDSARLSFSFLDLQRVSLKKIDSVWISGKFKLEGPLGDASWLRLELPYDDAVSNNFFDTLLVKSGASPVLITEVHHCPSEPEPEWVEVYNGARLSLPLSRLHFVGRGRSFGLETDSIKPFESIVLTRDSAGLRSVLGFEDVRIFQENFGYLNNTSGSLALAFDSSLLDSVSWDKNSVKCPAGFNPHTNQSEFTPGFQGQASQKVLNTPLKYTLSSRVVRKGKKSLRVRIESESEVSLQLLDSAHRRVWSMNVPASSNAWWNVPAGEKLPVGVGFVMLSVGDYASVQGIVVRP